MFGFSTSSILYSLLCLLSRLKRNSVMEQRLNKSCYPTSCLSFLTWVILCRHNEDVNKSICVFLKIGRVLCIPLRSKRWVAIDYGDQIVFIYHTNLLGKRNSGFEVGYGNNQTQSSLVISPINRRYPATSLLRYLLHAKLPSLVRSPRIPTLSVKIER